MHGKSRLRVTVIRIHCLDDSVNVVERIGHAPQLVNQIMCINVSYPVTQFILRRHVLLVQRVTRHDGEA